MQYIKEIRIMCGIFFYVGRRIGGETKRKTGKSRQTTKQKLEAAFEKIKHRGPDLSLVKYYNDNVMVGFHRLAIVDPTRSGMQPFEIPFRKQGTRFVCVVNGEIYNYETLKQHYSLTTSSHSDCEVVGMLFVKFLSEGSNATESLNKLCNTLDGEFTFIIYDIEQEIVYYATDELRTRPLFMGYSKEGTYFASEQKALISCNQITPVPNATYGVFNPSTPYLTQETKYFSFDFNSLPLSTNEKLETETQILEKLRELLIENVRRKLNPERDFCFLLSGGLDSSLVCGIAAKLLYPSRIRTFTVGFCEDAPDVLAAREVAKHINSIHTEFIFSFEEGIKIIPEVIRILETWDQTTIRASVPMYLACRAIKQKHPEMAVIYSGEISDELLMGYMEFKLSDNLSDLKKLSLRRLDHITYFDGLRADRVITSVGCELRLPFFGKELLKFILSLDPEYLAHQHHNGIEKYLLRKAFDDSDGSKNETGYLPQNILWRTKHAFSDATSIPGKKSWKEFIKSYADTQVTDSRFNKREVLYSTSNGNRNVPQTKEDMWYREIFTEYGYESSCIPYKWLPAFSNTTDASATELSVFTSNY